MVNRWLSRPRGEEGSGRLPLRGGDLVPAAVPLDRDGRALGLEPVRQPHGERGRADRVALPGGGGARLVGRRGDGTDLTWQVVPDSGTDLAAPGVQAAVDDALADLRSELA